MRVIATLTSCCRDTTKDIKDGHDYSVGANRRQSRSGSLGGLLDVGPKSPSSALVIGDPTLISQPTPGENLSVAGLRQNTEPMPATEAEVEVCRVCLCSLSKLPQLYAVFDNIYENKTRKSKVGALKGGTISDFSTSIPVLFDRPVLFVTLKKVKQPLWFSFVG